MVGVTDARWYDFGPLGLGRNDDCCLYIVHLPAVGVARGEFSVAMAAGHYLVQRHSPILTKSKVVTGPFPTLEAAKAAYLVLAPRYPGP